MLTSASAASSGFITGVAADVAAGVGTSTPFERSTSANALASCSAASARACSALTSRVNPSTRLTYSELISFMRSDAATPWSISLFFRFSMWSRNTSFSCLALIALRSWRCTSSSVGSRANVSAMYETCSDTCESESPGEPLVKWKPGLLGAESREDLVWGTPGELSAPGAMLDDLEMVPSGVRGAPPGVLRRDAGVRRIN